MPRGRKKSEKTAEKPVVVKEKVKERKPYPSIDERIDMANEKIEKLAALNDKRQALITKTEKKLSERKSSFEKTEEVLVKERAKLERLKNSKNKPATKEEKRAQKAAQREKIANLLKALNESGKSVDDLLEFLGK